MEELLWKGKPFNFGIPSFTTYEITESRLIIERGIFTKRRDEIRLYRIRDIALKRSLFERMLGIGDITIFSSDASHPEFKMRNIKDSKTVADILGAAVEKSRIKHRSLEVAGLS